MAKVCGNGTGTEGALYDLKNVRSGTKCITEKSWGTESITERSRGTESITEKSRGRGSAKCGKGRQAKQGVFRTSRGAKRPFKVRHGQHEMGKKKRGQLSETSSQVEQAWGHGQR